MHVNNGWAKYSLRGLFVPLALLFQVNLAHAGKIAIYAEKVDDRIDIYLNGTHQASCTWQKNPGCKVGVQGNADGTVKVRFKLTNFVYKGFCLTGDCGKYAADLYIEHEGRIIWSDSIGVKNNTEGVKFDKTVTCNLRSNSCN